MHTQTHEKLNSAAKRCNTRYNDRSALRSCDVLLTDDVLNFLLRLLTELFEPRRQIALQIPVERFRRDGEQHAVIVVVAERTLDDAAKLRVHPLVV